MRCFAIVLAMGCCLAAFTAVAAHTEAHLLLSAGTAKAGDTVLAGIRLKMEPGWHTYWKNPGDAGQATKIKWQLPAGVTAEEIQWPVPKKLPPAEVTTYGYEDEVVLIVPLKLENNLLPGSLKLSAEISWLECKESCIPASQTVDAELVMASESKASPDAAAIDLWKGKTPLTDGGLPFHAFWEKPATGETRPLIIYYDRPMDAPKNIIYDLVDFFPDASDPFEIQPAVEIMAKQSASIRFRKFVKKFFGDWPEEVSGVVVIESAGQRYGYNVKLPVAENPPAGTTISSAANPTTALPPPPLALMLFYAFIGGLILNIMPCVLPVIALKILGFVSEAKSSPRHVRLLGGIYALGVLFSFLVFAAVVIGVKSAGHQAGWGMQFSNPVFIVCLTTLITLVALNLFGVFEVTLGGGALNHAGELASKHGAAGAFFNGMLATALATPCTAPILGYALGFAFAQPAPLIILMFLMVGLGLASPYILLSWNPAWLKFLPKPGAWMEKFKIAMAFPVLGTAVWLFTLASGLLDKSRWLWFGLFLIALALAAWIWGEFVQRGTKHRVAAMLISLFLAGSFGAYAYYHSPDLLNWQPWSPEAVAKARADGHPVLVDFTAAWCLTCQVNKMTSLETSSVREKLNSLGAVALVGDYTHTPDNITTELERYHRAGVPLVLVFPKDAAAPAIVLPEVLTPGIVIDALTRAAK